MPCFHPIVMGFDGELTEAGKPKWKILGPLKRGQYAHVAHDDILTLVPCKKCIGCRMDYARGWSNRMLMELDHWQNRGIFVTLTYRDADLPKSDLDYPTLRKDDMQRFFKRLRKAGFSFRYYYCGEYGSRTRRPHYHVIFFGLSMDDFPDAEVKFLNNLDQPVFVSARLADIWGHGIISLSPCSYKTFGYVSRYITKKVYKDRDGLVKRWYDETGALPEYTNMSNRPGIGMFYFSDHPDVTHDLTRLSLSDGSDVYDIPLPSKLLDKLVSDNPELATSIKEQRRILALEHTDSLLMQTDLDYIDYLANLEKDLTNRIKPLMRNFEKEM